MPAKLVVTLADSLLRGFRRWGITQRSFRDGDESFDACVCVASGCSLTIPWKDGDSALSMAVRALSCSSRNPQSKHLASDPPVRVILLKAADSVAGCRAGEEFPRVVADRRRSRLVTRFETPWSICDLEDVVKQQPCRKRWPEIESCKLRSKRGLYDETPQGDPHHFRPGIMKRGGDELLKAVRRTAIARHGDSLDDRAVLLVLAAGWNTDQSHFSSLDGRGKAWRRAELIANAELCALDGSPLSVIVEKMRELVKRSRRSHSSFLRQSISSIRAIRPKKRSFLQQSISSIRPAGVREESPKKRQR